METGMKLGGIDLSGIDDPSAHIIKIMQAHPSEAVVLAALNTFVQVAEVKHCTIQNCHITGDKTVVFDSDFELKEGK